MKLHIFHKWGKWGTPFDSAHDNKKCQARQCEVCGKVEVAYVRSPWNWWFGAGQIMQSLRKEQP